MQTREIQRKQTLQKRQRNISERVAEAVEGNNNEKALTHCHPAQQRDDHTIQYHVGSGQRYILCKMILANPIMTQILYL